MSAKILRKHLRYDPENGSLWWILPGHKRHFDKPAGYLTSSGYREICLFCKCFKAHRVVWAIVKGRWPKKQIDHKDLDCDNNRWKNLRQATHGQNQQNGSCYKNNPVGLKGVTFHKVERKWRAQIQINKKRILLGRFPTPELAHLAYVKAAKKHFGEFARAS